MKHTRLSRVWIWLLAMLMIFSFASCEKSNTPQETTAPVPPPPAVLDPTAPFVPTSDYHIVYGALYGHSEAITEATSYLSAALYETYGIDCRVKNDTYSKQEGYQPARFEILIGDTNRAHSQSVYEMLGVNDYVYSVESAHVVVICGGSPEATLQAVRAFCADVLREGSTPANQPRWIPGTGDAFRDAYQYTSATFNGKTLANVTVAAKNNASCTNTALSITHTLGEYTGKTVPIVSLSQLTGREEIVICIGVGTLSGGNTVYFNGYRLSAKEQNGKLAIYLEASSAAYMEDVMAFFLDTLEKAPDGEAVALSFPSAFDQSYIADDNFWTLDSKTETEISDGVLYSEYLYYGKANKPYRMYVLDVDTTKNALHMGSAADGYDYTVEKANRENVKEHMQAAVANGLDVVAGVNADFFDIHGDYHPVGLAVKAGELIGPANGSPFFAVTKDGVPYVAREWHNTDLATTQTAVGGNPILLKNGLPVAGLMDDISVNPRTVVGIRADGSVLLVVIDGRQSSHSNGATFYQCALLLRQLGAVSAINLDGGGSTTMIIREGETYSTMNSPSDGRLRDVYNSLLIVKKG